jgi:hypothetical protein
MIQRCTNSNDPSWNYYGGRGITVCDRWRKFANFLADMGERPSLDHSLSRIDHNRNYEPGNAVWEIQNTGEQSHRRMLDAMGPAERVWFEMVKKARGDDAPKDEEFVCEEVGESINEEVRR